MNQLLLLLLLGFCLYLILGRVSKLTRIPVWLLWLIAMLPAFMRVAWTQVHGNKPPPPELFVPLLFICFFLSWLLLRWNRMYSAGKGEPIAVEEKQSPDAPPTEDPSILRPIDKTEETSLHNCFPWSIYYLQNIEYRPQAVICRGQLRSKPDVAYETIQENVKGVFGDRFLVLFQEGFDGKPFFALVANPRSQQTGQQSSQLTRPLLALSLFLMTFLTTSIAGAGAYIAGDVTQQQPVQNTFLHGLPYAVSLMAILGIHELAHYLAAQRHRVQATLPYFIPFPPLPFFPYGTFGAFIQIRSPIPNRKALFDIGISGPLFGFVVALPILLWGLAHSSVVPLPERPDILQFQTFNPKFSLLLTLLSKLALGGALTAKQAIDLSPMAIAGCLGIIVTALNLMPVGQLDGGHIVHAMFGQRTGAMIGHIARILLLLLAISQPHLMLWAIILFFLPANDEPALNDVMELDNRRDLWGLAALALLLLIIIPTPTAIANLLGI